MTTDALFAELIQSMKGPSCSRGSKADRQRPGMWPGFWHRPDGYSISVVGRRGDPGKWVLFDERHLADPIHPDLGEDRSRLAEGQADTLEQCWRNGCAALAHRLSGAVSV